MQQRSKDATTASHPSPSSSAQKAADKAKTQLACTKKLSLATLIGQKIMVAAYPSQLAEETPVLVAANVNGVIVMDAIPADQLATFRQAMHITPTLAVDQEGGTVQRYTAEGNVPGAETIASTQTAQQAYQTYLRDDQYLKQQGITTNFAPVVGVIQGTNMVLPGRMYADTVNTVTSYAGAAIRASNAVGITPVVKHFPGLGTASGNTDYGSATTAPLAQLQATDIQPYQALAAQHPDVMVANAIVPDLTDGQPAIWSKAAIDLLRSLGYQNSVVYTDSLTAKAIPGSLADAALKTWQAGTDVALIVQTQSQLDEVSPAIEAIVTRMEQAVKDGELSKENLAQSVLRIFTRKGVDACTLS